MSTRTLEKIAPPPPPHFVGDGFRVHNFIPSTSGLSMRRMDPFIMLDYNSKFHFPPSKHPRGVDVHPHRGFETVTIAYKGKVAHHDSNGGSGVIGEGEVQWMTAGSGVLHKEYHEENFSRKGGDFQMVQLWVNLPAAYKAVEPKYQAIQNADMGKFAFEGGIVEVISGDYKGVKGGATTFTPINLMNVKLTKGTKIDFSFPNYFNTAFLVVEGSVKFVANESIIPTNHFALLANDGNDFTLEAVEDSLVLLLSAEPINEPIAAQGPFVMNTHDELKQAFEDFYDGKFGHLR